MEAKKPLNYPSDAQSLHALVNELKLMLSSPVLDNGAVLVGLLPKQRCCCDGSCCRGVEHKQTREDEETRDNKEIQERKEAGESKHSLEGVWEGEGSGAVIFIHAVQGKPGYLFGTKLLSTGNHAQFWVRISDGTLVGKALRLPSGSWDAAKIQRRPDDTIEIMWADGSGIARFTRARTNASEVMVD